MQRKYMDERFIKYMVENNFERAIYTEFSFPYYIKYNSGFYSFETSIDIVSSGKKIKRKVVFLLESYVYNDQKAPLRESTFEVKTNMFSLKDNRYKVASTNIHILIQSFEYEREYINGRLNSIKGTEHKDNENDILFNTLQSCLELILHKYNETTKGVHTINPSVYDCSYMPFYYITSSAIIENALIYPNIGGFGQLDDTDFSLSLNKDIIIWRSFYNESIYSFRVYDFKKSIIYSAVALESYIQHVIDSNNIVEPSQYELSERGNFLPLYVKISRLIKDGYIQTSLPRQQLKIEIDNITHPRNKMMHGKLSDFFELKDESKLSINSLRCVLKDWEAISEE
jgi:hypothetical protein